MTRGETFGCVNLGLQMYHLTPNDTAWLCAKCVNDRKQGLADPKDVLMQEFLEAGRSLELTERDLVVLLYKGVWDPCNTPLSLKVASQKDSLAEQVGAL